MIGASALNRLRIPLLLSLFAAALVASEAGAHLSMIRQGIEAHGSLESGDFHGEVLAAGDFNGDGFDDLAMGAPREDGGSTVDVGVVFYNFGSTHGITHLGAFSRNAGDFGPPFQEGARFGSALASADLDRDGFDDLVVGAPREDVDGKVNAGRVYLLRGTPTGLQPWIAFKQEDLGGFSVAYDYFGYSFAIDDFNLDGHPDLAIGSPSSVGGAFVFIAYGEPGGPFGSTDILATDILGFLHQDADLFGFALAAGNVVGSSSHPDLIIGAPRRDNFTQPDAGSCFVVRGSDTGLQHADAISFDSGIGDAPQANAQFGYSLTTGRFSAGSYDWIAVGEPRAWVNGQERAGRVTVIHGRSDGLFPEMSAVLTQEGFGGVSEEFDEFGYSLAAGYFGEEPQFEDLYIGSPIESVWGTYDGGASLLFGNWGGPGSGGYMLYGQSWSGEFAESYDMFGYAAAFGEFDDTGYDNLAVSAPGEDDISGMVHVIAPWRQVPYLSCRQSLVMDCEDNIVFSQKPFDPVLIASTTKIITVLIACERSQLPTSHPRHVPLGAMYTVPDWVANNISGSQVPLEAGEQMSLENLMITCLFLSGNDAAHAIADLLWGSLGPDKSIPLFVEEMNTRAQELGLANTSFNNPNGFENEAVGPDLGWAHQSTAYDMALLSRAAMENELFNQISRTMNVTMTRNFVTGPVEFLCGNFFTWILSVNHPRGSGIKGGFTPAAQTTGCFSVDGFFNEAIATTFGTSNGPAYRQDALDLVLLGEEYCTGVQAADDEWDSDHFVVWDRIPAIAQRAYKVGGIAEQPLQDLRFDLFYADHWNVSDTHARMGISRISEVMLDPNQTEVFGIQPFESHDVLRLVNMESDPIKLRVVRVDGGSGEYPIGPHETLLIPAYDGEEPAGTWTVQNLSGVAAHLTVEESYGFLVDRPAGPPADPVFSAVLTRGDRAANESYALNIEWLEDGGEYTAMIHDSDVVVATPDSDPVVRDGGVKLVPPSPNPFREQTRLGLALIRPASLGLAIYDVTGREVRRFEAVPRPAGAWSIDWNGQDDEARSVPPGVYFYKFLVDGQSLAGGKLLRVQ